MFRSQVGLNWSKYIPEKLGKYDYCSVIQKIESNFVIGGNYPGDNMYISQDGVNWTKVIDESNVSFYEIIWDDIGFKVFSDSGKMFWSNDGIVWKVSFIGFVSDNPIFASNGDSYIIVTNEEFFKIAGNVSVDRKTSFIVGKNYGEKPISIFLNDSKLVFDTLPLIENGRTMVPMRAIFEALGAQVKWDERSKSVTCVKDDKKIVLTIGSNQAIFDSGSYTLETAPKIVNGRTLVPLRFVSESLGTEVLWNETKHKVSVYQKQQIIK